MIKLSGREIELNRVETARRVAAEYNVVVILKGAPTVVARPGGDVFINSTGNPGMATAGAGDVLAGVVVALLGQKLNALDASMAGVYLHGLAGDIAKENLGAMSLISTDIMRCLPSALMRLKVTQTQA
jgi:NAD(P)H-hydrate epimerase